MLRTPQRKIRCSTVGPTRWPVLTKKFESCPGRKIQRKCPAWDRTTSSPYSQLVGLHSLVALRNRFYPDGIWWARTQVYPDGVVGVLNRALAIPNSRACRNSVVIGDWILSLKGTTWWNQRPFAVGNNSVLLFFCFRKRTIVKSKRRNRRSVVVVVKSKRRNRRTLPFRCRCCCCFFAAAGHP